jgi:hypothetical protein
MMELQFSVFSMKNKVEEVNSYHLPISLFNRLATSDRRVISSFVLKSKLFCFFVIARTVCLLA